MKKKDSFLEKTNTWLQIIAALFTILGISIFTLVGPLKSHIKLFRVSEAEAAIEQIKISESRAYIESVLGIPNITTTLDYYGSNDAAYDGQKVVYNHELFLLIIYYDNSDSCLGYILVAKDPSFAPELFRGDHIFSMKMEDSDIDNIGNLIAVGHFLNSRADCSSYHIQYYSHHLGTNGCYLGVGVSDLGYWSKEYANSLTEYNEKLDEITGNTYFEEITNDTRREYINRCQMFDSIKPNVFSVFDNANSLDINELLKTELNCKLGLSHVEYRRITE